MKAPAFVAADPLGLSHPRTRDSCPETLDPRSGMRDCLPGKSPASGTAVCGRPVQLQGPVQQYVAPLAKVRAESQLAWQRLSREVPVSASAGSFPAAPPAAAQQVLWDTSCLLQGCRCCGLAGRCCFVLRSEGVHTALARGA